jgi:hypothetical protein
MSGCDPFACLLDRVAGDRIDESDAQGSLCQNLLGRQKDFKRSAFSNQTRQGAVFRPSR